MKGTEIKLGYAPTRRSIFSAPDAIKYRGLTKDRLLELGVSFVDIDGINPEGLLYDDKDVAPILEKFRKEKVDCLFVPHCNFGTEYVVARLARELGCRCCCGAPGRAAGRERRAPAGQPVRPVRHRQGAAAVPGALYLYDQLPPDRPGVRAGREGFSGGVQRGEGVPPRPYPADRPPAL